MNIKGRMTKKLSSAMGSKSTELHMTLIQRKNFLLCPRKALTLIRQMGLRRSLSQTILCRLNSVWCLAGSSLHYDAHALRTCAENIDFQQALSTNHSPPGDTLVVWSSCSIFQIPSRFLTHRPLSPNTPTIGTGSTLQISEQP